MTEIQALHDLHANQKKAFAANPYPSLTEREERLDAVAAALVSNRDRIQAALKDDYSVHPNAQTDFIEIFGVVGRLQYAKSMLKTWMARDERELNPDMYATSKAYILPQPKGVIGNIVPWNFPFDLGVGPLAEMLAAGNSVIIKPSDMTPACGEVLDEMLQATISQDVVAVVPGDVELAQAFSSLPWDHLLYTGNPEVARLVAAAAAQHLTPLTLELGGKCPVICTEQTVTQETIASILRTKMIKNGQMCVTPDYALVPRSHVNTFVQEAETFFANNAPDYSQSDQVTGVINDRHVGRIEGLIVDAKSHGAKIVTLGGEGASNSRALPIRLVIDPPADSQIIQSEIFGPILSVVPYDSLDDAISYIAQGERPLGVYAYTDDENVKQRITNETQSGGVSFNVCSAHAGLANMGFGGSGLSGYGRHHGIEGFREFSNPRGFMDYDQAGLTLNIAPPYGEVAEAILDGIINGEH